MSARRRKKKDIQKLLEVNESIPTSVFSLIESGSSASDQSPCNCGDVSMTFDTCPQTPQKEVFTENNRNIAFKKIRTDQFNFHLGALLFAPIMNKMSEKGLGFIRQFLVSILLGCHNIEQNKMLNYKSLEQLIGQAYKTLRTQRTLLKESATLHNIEQVLKFNADLLEVNKQSDFYDLRERFAFNVRSEEHTSELQSH